MSVVTFFGSDRIETSQTASLSAIATYLSIEQNYRILIINANYNDSSFQDFFWEENKNVKPRADLETGITGLVKATASNKISPEIITNYTKTIFKDRLELLTDGNIPKEDYEKQKTYMKNIVKMANKYYDLVFIDIKGNIEAPYIQEILAESDLIVANTSQRIKKIKQFLEERRRFTVINKKNVIILIGKYDKFSKYNVKNIQRLFVKQEIYAIPYNTTFFESCSEGQVADFIINYRKEKQASAQGPIIEAISKVSNAIINKLKELKLQE